MLTDGLIEEQTQDALYRLQGAGSRNEGNASDRFKTTYTPVVNPYWAKESLAARRLLPPAQVRACSVAA